ncbi:MAG: Uma2 family endonuclease [Phormidium sp. BM_Day4_Bin.17]|nr:Uma2 family endonuclease [Phormidium sp. BM_Day4_Bin.17]UCJ13769.1 MAG: Uma2 family endonuclease [Phormidium sp. PBR-2020]
MTLSTQTRYTPDEYRQLEARAQQRHEYRDGEIVPMPGGSLEHSRICGNIFAYLKFLLRDTQFEPINSDLRLWVPAYNRGLYPDVMVFDGAPTLNGDRNDEVLDPIAIVEVLSPSTQAFDREDKFLFYRSIPNFCEYILVRQTVPSIDRYTRQESGWWLQEFSGWEASLPIESIGLDMPLAEIYRGVNLDD